MQSTSFSNKEAWCNLLELNNFAIWLLFKYGSLYNVPFLYIYTINRAGNADELIENRFVTTVHRVDKHFYFFLVIASTNIFISFFDRNIITYFCIKMKTTVFCVLQHQVTQKQYKTLQLTRRKKYIEVCK